MKSSSLIIIVILSSTLIKAQSVENSTPTSSVEFNIGSMRPLGIYAESLPKEGMLDLGMEYQTNIKRIFDGESSYFPLSIGMKIGYNYYSLVKEKTGDRIYDTTGLISMYKYEFKYTLRAHALNFHPSLELSTPQDWPVIVYAKGYWGPTTTWATSKFRHITEDSQGKVTKDKTRDYAVNRWTIDYGYKIGVGFKLGSSFITCSYTRLWGGEIEYLGKGSVKSYDPLDPSKIVIEPIKSSTDRYIIHLGIKRVF